MSVDFPERDTIEKVLSLATRAPSVHNSQPWQWRVGMDCLDLHADSDVHLPSTDPDGRDLMLSCGVALHHCVVALAALGWGAKVHRFPDLLHPQHLASLEVYRHPANELDIKLAAAIPRRRTDRRHYSPWPVPMADIVLMGTRAAHAGVMVRQVESLPKLRHIVAQAVWQHAADHDYVTELTAWSGRHASGAGVPARNIPEPDPTALIPGRVFAGPELAQPPETDPADDNAIVLAIGTTEDDQLARLQAGEATSFILLTATALGLSSCPVTEPLEIAETRAAVQEDVFGTSGYPQMLLRVGWAPVNAEPLPSTPRRPLTDVVKWPGGPAGD